MLGSKQYVQFNLATVASPRHAVTADERSRAHELKLISKTHASLSFTLWLARPTYCKRSVGKDTIDISVCTITTFCSRLIERGLCFLRPSTNSKCDQSTTSRLKVQSRRIELHYFFKKCSRPLTRNFSDSVILTYFNGYNVTLCARQC